MSDIDIDHVHGVPPSPSAARPGVSDSPAVELCRRVVPCRQAGVVRVAALDDIDGVPSSLGTPSLLFM